MTRDEALRRVRRLRHDRVPYVSATVVRAERPTSAKPGDTALILGDGTLEGFVGGQCAEQTVRQQSLQTLMSGEPTLLRITPGAGEEAVEQRPGLIAVSNPCLSGGTLDIFLEPSFPRPLVAVYGEAPIARALAGSGRAVGYDTRGVEVDAAGPVTIPRGALAVVVASHGRREEEILGAALEAGVPYVGLVASRRRGTAVVGSLDRDDRDRVHTPAGLDIGARTPGEVALSILAEIVASKPRSGEEQGRAGERTDARADGPAVDHPETVADPVCGMSVLTGRATPSVVFEGRRHWFCGSGCQSAFAADPRRYLGATAPV